MSTNRNKDSDRRNTKAQLINRTPPVGPTNWLGHKVSSGAAAIDSMLIDGATIKQMEENARGGVQQHLRHLKLEYDLPVVKQGDKYMFDRTAL